MIIVGSSALSYFGMNRKPVADVDRWFSPSEEKCGKEDDHVIPDEVLALVPTKNGYATPDAIYTIKCSHFHWDIHWQKTKLDILWLKSRGCVIIPELYTKLKEHWIKEHGDKDFLSLMKNKEDFFTDMVEYKYDHDYLHELVAYPNKPMYTKCLKDGHEVLTDWNKFCKMSYEDRVRMLREEVTVIAVERWLTNSYWHGKVDWYLVYMWSLKKTVTRLVKGKFADFMVQNIDQFVTPDYSYFEHILKTLEEENLMSKVDISIFEELKKELQTDDCIESVVWYLCEGDYYFDSDDTFEGDWEEYNNHTKSVLDKAGYEHLEQDGGGEGGSEYCYGVFKMDGKIYKAEYSYYSHHGHDYDDITSTLREVKPVSKTITVYE